MAFGMFLRRPYSLQVQALQDKSLVLLAPMNDYFVFIHRQDVLSAYRQLPSIGKAASQNRGKRGTSNSRSRP